MTWVFEVGHFPALVKKLPGVSRESAPRLDLTPSRAAPRESRQRELAGASRPIPVAGRPIGVGAGTLPPADAGMGRQGRGQCSPDHKTVIMPASGGDRRRRTNLVQHRKNVRWGKQAVLKWNVKGT